jgi:murein DD-endopeptidase MepM/ murein hydrolase activator NlpD
MLYACLGSGPAWSADARLDQARADREAAQAKLGDLLQRVGVLEAEVSAAERELDALTTAEQEHRHAEGAAQSALTTQMVAAYKHASLDPTLALLSSESPSAAAEHARLLSLLARRSRAEIESASSARVRTHASALQVAEASRVLKGRQVELATLRTQAEQEVAKAQQIEDEVEAQIALEAAGAAVGATAGGTQMAAAPLTGSLACPVGNPHNFTDTYGAPRSGGRSHMGVDILAPRGVPIYAYESGTVTRTNSSSLGGISLYLQGDSGNQYYYTHLRGYVGGVSAGMRVSAGQHIAFNGDTGNAAGIPHLHWEVRPGGGSNVNPYPYAKRACG